MQSSPPQAEDRGASRAGAVPKNKTVFLASFRNKIICPPLAGVSACGRGGLLAWELFREIKSKSRHHFGTKITTSSLPITWFCSPKTFRWNWHPFGNTFCAEAHNL